MDTQRYLELHISRYLFMEREREERREKREKERKIKKNEEKMKSKVSEGDEEI